ncbi:MAG: hypothetical protein ACYTX0_56845, partial [Nostoc sp.]
MHKLLFDFYINTLGLTISFFSLRRASCYPSGSALAVQVGEPQGRTGFSAPTLGDAARWRFVK